MTNLNVSLPEPMRSWIEAQVAGGRYGNASEYVRELIRRDQERQAEERLDQLLLEGLSSGPATPMTPEDWADIRKQVAERFAKHKERSGKATREA
ncbi:MAG: type II toxin-antitoxin system ParD family antitoxin [Candidatus Eisenbacteria bacterium]|nr:type II toxin-antitoxin system ParD family antitoxin [Candidatus Eisenbacteria bacterium]